MGKAGITVEDWIWDNVSWQLDPPQEFIDNWTRVFRNYVNDLMTPAWQDLWFLHNWVKEKKPQSILEFGSGYSTVVMAHALWHNRKGWIDSVEDKIEWIHETQKMIPSYLFAISTIYHCPIMLREHEGEYVLQYYPLFPMNPDFIYLDGPAAYESRITKKPCKVTINPFELEPFFPKGFTMIVDAREATVDFFIKHFKRHYKWTKIGGLHNGLAIFELLE